VLSVRDGVADPVRSGATPAGPSLLDLDGRSVDPFDAPGAKALVFVFLAEECPIANRYAPEIRRLHETFAPQGASFRLVYADRKADAAALRRHRADFGLNLPALRDPEHALVRRAEVQVTPEAAVFLPRPDGPALVYHGRIDDRFAAVGRARPAPTTHDLKDALQAVLEGRPVPRASAPAVGCFLADLR
jgi:hypothetical protein